MPIIRNEFVGKFMCDHGVLNILNSAESFEATQEGFSQVMRYRMLERIMNWNKFVDFLEHPECFIDVVNVPELLKVELQCNSQIPQVKRIFQPFSTASL
jgi:hypothetical protein